MKRYYKFTKFPLKNNNLALVLSALLIAAGLVVLNFGGPPSSISAQTTSYNSKWTANRFLIASDGDNIRKVFAGVWGWSVSGNVAGGTSFQETWTAPSLNNISYIRLGGLGCAPSQDLPTGVIGGCTMQTNHLNNNTFSSIKFSTSPNILPGTSLGPSQGSPQPGTSSCAGAGTATSGEFECLFQTGAYSVSYFYEMGHPTRNRWLGTATLMPLEWNVSGTITN